MRKIEHISRIYDTLRNFVGNNEIHKLGDILFVSTKNNKDYDLIIHADGVSNFITLYNKENGGGSMEKWETIFEYDGQLLRNSENHYGLNYPQKFTEIVEDGDKVELFFDNTSMGVGEVYQGIKDTNIRYVNVVPNETDTSILYNNTWSIFATVFRNTQDSDIICTFGLYIYTDTPTDTGTHKIELKKKIS